MGFRFPKRGAVRRIVARDKSIHRVHGEKRNYDPFCRQSGNNGMTNYLFPEISVNARARKIVERLCADQDALRLKVQRTAVGALLIDAGVEAPGGLEAGRLIAEICLGGLGRVSFTHHGAAPDWPLTLHVVSSNPVLACLASQYAGWSLSHGEGKGAFHALGSGPGRALACKEPLFEELRYRDRADHCVLVFEVDRPPPEEVIAHVAEACGLAPKDVTIILTPTSGLAGSTQVVARVLEVALHKARKLGFALESIVDGTGSAPLAPPTPDFTEAMGRTNDAILFAGQVQLFVAGAADAAQDLAERLPSGASKDYGKPFAQVFRDHDCDFFKIDSMLFSPAKVAVTHLPSGRTFHAGEINLALLDQSFSK